MVVARVTNECTLSSRTINENEKQRKLTKSEKKGQLGLSSQLYELFSKKEQIPIFT